MCDNLALPFRDESFDAVLSIAVVHHFATTDRRVQALRELARVLRIGGKLIISVWAMEQRHRKVREKPFRLSIEKIRSSLEKLTILFWAVRISGCFGALAQTAAFEHAVFGVHFYDYDDDDDDVGRRRTSALSRVYADVRQRIGQISEVNLFNPIIVGKKSRSVLFADELICPLFI